MLQLRQEILAFTRACEHLIAKPNTLNDDEGSLIEFYVNDLAREFSLNSSSAQPVSQSTAQQSLPL